MKAIFYPSTFGVDPIYRENGQSKLKFRNNYVGARG